MAVCPRCKAALLEKTATPPGRRVAVTLDTCGGCRGMWLDGAELPYVSEVLGELVVRHRELIGQARPAGIDCPRCGGALHILEVGEVAIDWCQQCFGVWLDGGEYQAIEQPQTKPSERRSADVRCGRCQRAVPLGQTLYSSAGLLCSPCYEKDAADTKWAAQFHRPIANQMIAASESMLTTTPQDEIRSLRREVSHLRSQLNRF